MNINKFRSHTEKIYVEPFILMSIVWKLFCAKGNSYMYIVQNQKLCLGLNKDGAFLCFSKKFWYLYNYWNEGGSCENFVGGSHAYLVMPLMIVNCTLSIVYYYHSRAKMINRPRSMDQTMPLWNIIQIIYEHHALSCLWPRRWGQLTSVSGLCAKAEYDCH